MIYYDTWTGFHNVLVLNVNTVLIHILADQISNNGDVLVKQIQLILD